MGNAKVRKAKAEVKLVLRGSRAVAGVSADAVETEFQRIYGRDGELRASKVLDEARPAEAPLHPAFEWDNTKAAEEFRLHQARNLIKAVTIIRPYGEAPAAKWVHVKSQQHGEREGAYHPVEVVAARPDLFALALQELLEKVGAAQRSADALRQAAQESGTTDAERMAKIALAIEALHTAGAAVQALH